MDKTEIMNKATRVFYKVGFKIRKRSPEILMGVGVVGVVTSTVMACKATMKANDIIEETKEEMKNVKFVAMAAGVTDIPEDISEHDKAFVEAIAKQPEAKNYTAKDMRNDTFKAYLHSAAKFAKLYGPSIIVGVTSIGMMITSNGILKKRNFALAAAYATVDKGFKEYRSRVIERFGEEMDKELRHNIKAQKFKETIVDEDGKEKTVKTTVGIADPTAMSVYAKCFDETCAGWSRDAEYNLAFLKQQENYANGRLKARGYLFLNEVYDSLGIPRTRAGQCVGWVYDEKNPIGDNYVDFGIYDINKESNRLFVNGYEKSIWLDFNVDGDILSNF